MKSMSAQAQQVPSISALMEQLSEQEKDLQTVVSELEQPMLEICVLLEKLRELEKAEQGDGESQLTRHFIAGLQSHDLFSQRVQHALKVINDMVASKESHSASWVYKATWLGGALIEEARREYVRGFNEISMGLTDIIQAENRGYLPPLSAQIARPISVSLASIRGFGKRIREVSNVLEALGSTAFAEVAATGGEANVSESFAKMLEQYSFEDEKRTHHKILDLPVPAKSGLGPGDAVLF